MVSFKFNCCLYCHFNDFIKYIVFIMLIDFFFCCWICLSKSPSKNLISLIYYNKIVEPWFSTQSVYYTEKIYNKIKKNLIQVEVSRRYILWKMNKISFVEHAWPKVVVFFFDICSFVGWADKLALLKVLLVFFLVHGMKKLNKISKAMPEFGIALLIT